MLGSRETVGAALALVVGVGLGLAAESFAFGWSDPMDWMPDLLVGWTFLVAGLLAWRTGSLPTGALLYATGITWFLGNFSPDLLYLHRGPLVHVLVAYPGWRPKSRLAWITLGVGYVCAVAPALWGNDAVALSLAALLLITAVTTLRKARGRARHHARIALLATLAFDAGVILATLAPLVRIPLPGGVLLLAYEAALCGTAIVLAYGVRAGRLAPLTDLVVELGESRSGLLRDRLAQALGDPSLQVGYWSPEVAGYLDDSGTRVPSASVASGRVATEVRRANRPYLVIVHDPAVLTDPLLVESVAAAARLASSNVDLQAAARDQIAELTASRRQFVVAAARERAALERRLREGPERQLAAIADLLDTVGLAGVAAQPHLVAALTHVVRTRQDLAALAQGLHPRTLTDHGLAESVRELGESAPFELTVESSLDPLPDEAAVTCWYVCAEALANVTKHAHATQVRVSLASIPGGVLLTVADDGVGGAEVSGGSGLQGLADRVASLGGRWELKSVVGDGTRLVVELPLDHQP